MSLAIYDKEFNNFDSSEENLKSKGIKRLAIIQEGLDLTLYIRKTSYTGFEKDEERIKDRGPILDYLRSL